MQTVISANTVHLEPGCPWYSWSEIHIPNVKWCENQFCSWIVEPANAWSNFAYIIAGFFLLYFGYKNNNRVFKLFGWVQQAVGWTSFLYHLSYTFIFQVADFMGMFFLMGTFIFLNLRRLGKFPDKFPWAIYLASVLLLTMIVSILGWYWFPIQSTVGILVLITFALETVLYLKKDGWPTNRFYFLLSAIAIAIGAGFSASDVSRAFCDPDNHFIQGHAIWHVCGGFSLTFAALFYQQFNDKKIV